MNIFFQNFCIKNETILCLCGKLLINKNYSLNYKIPKLEMEIISKSGLEIYSKASFRINIFKNSTIKQQIGYVSENAQIGQKILQINCDYSNLIFKIQNNTKVGYFY